MSSEHVVIVHKNKVYVARKRAGLVSSYVVMAEVASENAADKIALALNGGLNSDNFTLKEADAMVVKLIEQTLPAGSSRDAVISMYRMAASKADA